MTSVKPSAESTTSVVTNLTTFFTPAVADYSTKESTGDKLLKGLSAVKSLMTEEEMGKVVSAIVGGQFAFTR